MRNSRIPSANDAFATAKADVAGATAENKRRSAKADVAGISAEHKRRWGEAKAIVAAMDSYGGSTASSPPGPIVDARPVGEEDGEDAPPAESLANMLGHTEASFAKLVSTGQAIRLCASSKRPGDSMLTYYPESETVAPGQDVALEQMRSKYARCKAELGRAAEHIDKVEKVALPLMDMMKQFGNVWDSAMAVDGTSPRSSGHGALEPVGKAEDSVGADASEPEAKPVGTAIASTAVAG